MIVINEKLTKHFLLYDFVCKCCGGFQYSSIFLKHLELLEQMRIKLGFPLYINSGFRCYLHNKQVGGTDQSWHLIRLGAKDINRKFATDISPIWIKENNDDIFCNKINEIYKCAKELFNGIGIYNSFIHCDLRPVKTEWNGKDV